jgi:hypothetical protein
LRAASTIAAVILRATILAALVFGLAACGGGTQTSSSSSRTTTAGRAQPGHTGTVTRTGSATVRAVSITKPRPTGPTYPRLLPAASAADVGSSFTPVVSWQGQPAAWLARTPSGVTLLAFDQHRLELRLHSGTSDAGTFGWRFGPSVAGSERRRIVAAFNGGFRLSVGAGGFESYGRVAVALRDGLGSIVTYADGTTDIGAWHQGVPAPGHQVLSVRQNLTLLVDHGQSASTVDCLSCWGATLGGVSDPARSALGVTADGHLVWAGGEHLTVAQLADALVGAHVVRAVELDINPEWVAGYLYGHRGGHGPPAPIPAMPGQNGIPGTFLVPWSRDFFTVVSRG